MLGIAETAAVAQPSVRSIAVSYAASYTALPCTSDVDQETAAIVAAAARLAWLRNPGVRLRW